MQICISLLFLLSSILVHSQHLIINEVSSENYKAYYDEEYEDSDWIEIHNADSIPINLDSYRISDTDDFEKAWVLPNLTLSPGEYHVIYASGKARNGSNNYIVESSGNGIFPHAYPDSYRYGYVMLDGDFEISVRVLSMRNEDIWSNIGLVARETLSDTSKFYSIMALSDQRSSGHYALIYRTEGKKYPEREYISIKNEYPHCYLKLKREGNKFTGIVIDSKGEELSSVAREEFFPTTIYVGISSNSRDQNRLAKHTFSDLIVNNQPFAFDSLSFLDINCQIAGKSHYSNELHTDFKIDNDGEELFLWDKSGNIIDRIQVPALPANISYGRSEVDPQKGCYFDSISPGRPNKGEKEAILDVPTASKAGGWYHNSIEIKLSSLQNATIYYTLDGREPDTTSAIYTNPLQINETTILKAFAVKEQQIASKVIQNTYLLNERMSKVPTVCLSIDPDNLYDPDNGLFTHEFQNREFKAYFELWDSTGCLLYKTEAGVKNHGHGPARGLPQKSLRLYARSLYGNDSFDYPFFGDNSLKKYDKLVLRNGGGDWSGSLIRDGLHSRLTENIPNLDAPLYQPCIVYLNGKYWGIYGLIERVDEELIRDKYEVKKKNIDFLEDKEKLMHGNKKDYVDLNDYLIYQDLSTEEARNYISSKIDLDNYFKYMFLNFYSANYDWPEHNRKYWQAENDNRKWTWYVYDMDWTSNYDYLVVPKNDRFQQIINTADTSKDNSKYKFSKMFNGIIKNIQLRNNFINTSADLMNSSMMPNNAIKEIDIIYNRLKDEVPYHRVKWEESASNWDEKIESLREFFRQRSQYFREDIVQQFSLSDTSLIITNVNNPSYGYLRINSLTLKEFPWRGVYFDDVSIVIEAISYPGKRFVKWSDDRFGSTSKIVVNPKDVDQLTAIFERDITPYATVVVNEIMYKASEKNDSGDWIELYNPGDLPLDLTGCKLTDSNAENIYFFKSGEKIEGNSYFVLVRDKSKFEKIYPNVKFDGIFDFGLSDDDAVKIFSSSNLLLDSVDYNSDLPWPVESYNTGYSIELSNPELDNSQRKNWKRSVIIGGTPGAKNDTQDSMLDKSEQYYINAYPNPVNDYLNLESNIYNASYKLFNSLGAVVDQGNFSLYTVVNCQSLPNGLYTVKFFFGSQTESVVFIISR